MSTAAGRKERPNLLVSAVAVAVLGTGTGAGAYLIYSGAQDPPAPQATPSPGADLVVEDTQARAMLEENGDVGPLDLDSLAQGADRSQQGRDATTLPGPAGPSEPAPEALDTAEQAQDSTAGVPVQEEPAPASPPGAGAGSFSGSGIVDVGAPVLPEDFDPQDLGPYVRTTPVPAEMEALRLQVPSIYVDAGIVSESISASDRDQYGQSVMELPDSLGDVGWLNTTAALRSTEGTTLLAGHVTVEGVHGAVYFLGLTEPGALVKTTDADGRMSRWVITEVTNYAKTALPEDIFRPTGPRQLAIVTCGGEVVQLPDGSWSHEENIVVRAVPVE